MLTADKLYAILSEIYPTCEYDWTGHKEIPPPPYCAYVQQETETIGADNKTYCSRPTFDVELYIKKNDYESEGKLEKALDENEIYWEKGGRYYIKETKLVQIIYKV